MSKKNNRKAEGQISESNKENKPKFETDYESFLTELKYMPLSTKEEKDERWNFFQHYAKHDDFVMDLMFAFRPNAYKKFFSRLNNVENISYIDSGIETFKNKKERQREIDPKVFMEVIQKAIHNYTGIKKDGSSYGFVACIGIFYNQEAGKAASKNGLRGSGISDTEIPERNIPGIIKLVNSVKHLCWNDRDMYYFPEETFQKVLEEVLRTKKFHCTKKEIELIRALVFYDNITSSLDTPMVNDNDTKISFKDTLKDEKDDYKKVLEEDEKRIPFLEMFCQHIEENLKIITSAKELREQEFIKIFFTKDILKELKLDKNGKPYSQEPAGDEDFYCSLKLYGDILYHKMFYKQYLFRAFWETPEDFYEVYVKLLRKDFDFSDKLLAEVIGKDKFVISKKRKIYKNTMEAFHNYYKQAIRKDEE